MPTVNNLETIAAGARTFALEKTIFRLADPTADDSDWPIFELRDVVVMDKDRNYVRNLLRVQDTGPYIVRGRVYCDEDDESQTSHLLHPTKGFEPTDIEFTTTQMSIGFDDMDTMNCDEPVSGPVIWAKSLHGFYRLKDPSPRYSSMYRHMMEAVELYYTILTVYEEHSLAHDQHRSRSGKVTIKDMPLDEVLFKYVVMIGNGALFEEVIDRCIVHSPFLNAQFKLETSFDWKRTSFSRFVQSQVHHGDAWERLFMDNVSINDTATQSDRIKAIVIPECESPLADPISQNPELTVEAVARHVAAGGQLVYQKDWFDKYLQLKSSSNPEAPKSMPIRSHQTTLIPSVLASNDPAQSRKVAQALYDVLPEMLGRRRQLVASYRSVTKILWTESSAKTKQSVREILEFVCKDLVYLMDADTELQEMWRGTTLFQELLDMPETDKIVAKKRVEEMIKELHWRKAPGSTVGLKRPFEDTQPDSGRRQSSLRPPKRASVDPTPPSTRTNSVRASPATSTVVSTALPKVEDEPEEEVGPEDIPMASVEDRIEDTKEVQEPQELYEQQDQQEQKDDDEFAAPGPDESEESTPVPIMSPDSSHVAREEPPTSGMVRLAIREDLIPTLEPNSPDGSWICTVSGCNFIEEANENRHQYEQNVRQHLAEHESHISRVDLALSEGHGFAVSHLLEKLRNSNGDDNGGSKKKEKQGVPGPPPRIKRLFFGYV